MEDDYELPIGDTELMIGNIAGSFATLCFIIQYVPQMFLIYQKKSVFGFSATAVIVKLVGACFLVSNSYFLDEAIPVMMYGLINLIQHSIFIIQFEIYKGDEKNSDRYIHWLLFPFIPLLLSINFPATMKVTNFIKPICQVISHIPQVVECYRVKTSTGISLSSQHLNFIGGIAGCVFCYHLPPRSMITWLVYINSVAQAVSIYVIYIIYDVYPNQQYKKKKKDDIVEKDEPVGPSTSRSMKDDGTILHV